MLGLRSVVCLDFERWRGGGGGGVNKVNEY